MWFQFFLYSLAVWSITRLIAADAFPPMRRARGFVIDRTLADGELAGFGYLITCFWCLSVYVAMGVWLGMEAVTDWSFPAPFLWIMAARPVTGMLNSIEDLVDAVTAR